VMVSTFVPHECPTCGPVVETFVSAEVTCRCGRRCRLPAWGSGAARPETEAPRSGEKLGQKCWSERRGFRETADSPFRGVRTGRLAIRVLVAFRLVSGLFVGRCEEWRMSPCVLVVGPGGGLVRPRARG
jgi:hypothetical protein